MRSSMKAVATTTVLALLLGAGAAHAKDLCVKRADGTILAVLRGFKVPLKNRCRAVDGTQGSGVLSGTVCRSADGSVLRFGTTTNVGAGLFSPAKTRQHAFSLAYPAFDDGSGSEFVTDAGPPITTTQSYLSSMTAAYCAALDIP